MDIYETPKELNLKILDAETVYQQLTEQERQYAYHLYKASWEGALIVARQCSPESEELIDLIVKMFTTKSSQLVREQGILFGFTKEEIQDFLNYFTLVSCNLGNYRSFGDSKIIPRLKQITMSAIFMKVFPELKSK